MENFKLLEDKLEIFLITYNRRDFLEKTLDSIFSENSPIKECQITILDNKSTDGSTELIDEKIKNRLNVKHIVHNRNIGGNGNIARAIELAGSKKYFWVLCDDDEYNWDNWSEIENAINSDYDAIFTEISHFKHFKNDASILRQATFLPAVIYKTDLITSDVMQNAVSNIINLFPHLALICHVINENKRVFIPQKAIVIVGQPVNAKNTGLAYFTSTKENTHPYVRDMFYIVGLINSVQMIKDKKRRAFILNHISAKNTGFFREISANFKRNRMFYNNSFKNICDVFAGINFCQKIQFLLALIWLDFLYAVKRFILRDKRYSKNATIKR